MDQVTVSRDLLHEFLRVAPNLPDQIVDGLRAALDAPAVEPVGPSGDKLSNFSADQWWLPELDSAVANGTPDQKRAVAVVRNLLATKDVYLAQQPAPVGAINQLAAMVDAAMVEMNNIHPQLKRSECQRLILAAIGAVPLPQPCKAVKLTLDEVERIAAEYSNEYGLEGKHRDAFSSATEAAVIAKNWGEQ